MNPRPARPMLATALAVVLCLAFAQPADAATTVGEPNADRVFIASRPGLAGEVVAQVNRGQVVRVLETITLRKPATNEPASWLKIELPPGSTGWVLAGLIDAASKSVAVDVLNVRAAPNYDSGVIARVKKGTPVTTMGEPKDGWFQIVAPDESYGFVPSALMTVREGEPPPRPKPVQAPAPEPPTPTPATATAAAASTVATAQAAPTSSVPPPATSISAAVPASTTTSTTAAAAVEPPPANPTSTAAALPVAQPPPLAVAPDVATPVPAAEPATAPAPALTTPAIATPAVVSTEAAPAGPDPAPAVVVVAAEPIANPPVASQSLALPPPVNEPPVTQPAASAPTSNPAPVAQPPAVRMTVLPPPPAAPAPVRSPSITSAPTAATATGASAPGEKVVHRAPLTSPTTGVCGANSANVRSRPGIAGEVVTQLKKDQAVRVLESVTLKNPAKNEPANWYKIELPPDAQGWVLAEFVDADSKVVTADVLNVRAGPTYEHGVIARARKGTRLKAAGDIKDGWIQVVAPPGSFGFVAADLITLGKQDAPPSPPSSSSSSPTPQAPAAAGSSAAPAASVETGAPTAVVESRAIPEPAPTQTLASASPVTTETTALPVEPPPAAATGAAAEATASNPTPVEPGPGAVAPTDPSLPPADAAARTVRREGVVIRPVNISAPTFYALKARDSGRTINFLFTTRAEPINWREYRGRVVIVSGREFLDRRSYWRGIPLLDVATIEGVR